jgi:oxygen-independent coproporphyrinogen III oxidase
MIKSLYIHIPFCIKKCLYCDFNSCAENSYQEKYVEALINEVREIDHKKLETIFIGGGTPTILSLCDLEKLLKELSKFQPDEFTIEANPGTLTVEKLKLIKNYGVNRLSIGLQAWQDRLLANLGRAHKLGDFLSSYKSAREVGFNNINVDLMFGIPDQSMEDWIESIEEVLKLKPEHISSYSLIIEEGTPYFDMKNEGRLNLPDEETERLMFRYAVDRLNEQGIKHYEISNFAKEGYECKHNLTYWMDNKYIGCGAGAHSYIGNKRYYNVNNIHDYINSVRSGNTIQEVIELSKDDEISEFMFLGLRLTNGINKQRFKERFAVCAEDVYLQELSEFVSQGLVINDKDNIKLTMKGVEFSNQVFVKLLR